MQVQSDEETPVDEKSISVNVKESSQYETLMLVFKWTNKILSCIPFINILVIMLFGDIPSVDEIGTMNEVLGVISTLLLGIIISFPTGFDFGELTEADVRFSPDLVLTDSTEIATAKALGYADFVMDELKETPISQLLFKELYYGFILLCLIVVIVIVLHLLLTALDAKNEKCAKNKLWWFWSFNKWTYLCLVIAIWASMMNLIRACHLTMMIKFPDYAIEFSSKTGSYSYSTGLWENYGLSESVYFYMGWLQDFYTVIGAIVFAVLQSVPLFKIHVESELDEELEKNAECKESEEGEGMNGDATLSLLLQKNQELMELQNQIIEKLRNKK